MAMWIRTDKKVTAEGTTITYALIGANVNYEIESRKRHIPHANREGTWDHTSYFVLKDGKELVEKQSLADAKEYVEKELQRGEP